MPFKMSHQQKQGQTYASSSRRSSHKISNKKSNSLQLLASDAASGNREGKSQKQSSGNIGSSANSAILAYRQQIKEIIHGKKTVGFRKFLMSSKKPERAISGIDITNENYNNVEDITGPRRQLKNWKQTRHKTDFVILQQTRGLIRKNFINMNEQSNYANDNSIRESSNNSVEEDNIQHIGLTKFE